MKTSRISRETARVSSSLTNADFAPRRQTRAFSASLQAFAANGVPLKATQLVKLEDGSVHGSSLPDSSSSTTSQGGLDIEDLGLRTPISRKRKRDLASPTTAETTISNVRSSPRKSGINNEEGTKRPPTRAKRQSAKRVTGEDGEVKIEPPAGWEEIYDAVKEMRKDRLAPVDTMGCETLADPKLSPRDRRFQTLIALMLSSQTKDTTNAIAMRRLQTDLPAPGLTLENILAVDPVKLNEMIYVVGFHNNKTRFIKAAAEILRDECQGDIPDTVEGLMRLPGVGPKMAYLCLSAAWGRTEGIGVDVHVHRITNLWGWHKTKAPEETRLMLESWLPQDKWHEINHLLVGFGQTICAPVGRKCGECTLSERGLCPSAVVEKRKIVKSVSRESKVKTELEGKTMERAVILKEEERLG